MNTITLEGHVARVAELPDCVYITLEHKRYAYDGSATECSYIDIRIPQTLADMCKDTITEKTKLHVVGRLVCNVNTCYIAVYNFYIVD